MNRTKPRLCMSRRGASVARLGIFAAGLSVVWTANAANCGDAPVSGQKYYIVNKDSGLQLDVARVSQTVGADVIQWTGSSQTNQQWTFSELYRGIWTIRPVHSGQALDLLSYNPSENAAVKQYTYSGNANQQWLLANSGDAYTIASNSSKKLLTVGDRTAGSAVKLNSDQQGSGLQRWYFNPVDGKCSTGATGPWGSFMGFNRILIGGQLDERDPNNPNDTNRTDTINKAPWDLRYSYIHSATAPYAACYSKCELGCRGSPDGAWWGCWGMSSDGKWNTEPGVNIRTTNEKNANGYKLNGQPHRMIHQWTWYSGEDLGKMQGRLNQVAGGSGAADYKGAVQNWGLLKSYLDDYRFLLKKVGTEKNIIHLEPDFFGFLRNATGDNPHAAYAPVRFAGGDDCKSEEESLAGLVGCMVKMTRQYAPNSTVGLHFTCWNFKDAEKAKTCVTYYKDLGAGKGDFLVADVTDRDAAYAEYVENKGKSYWWNDQDFASFLSVIKGVTEAVGKPMILWQIPLGNENQWNATDHWKDQKVQLLFDHMEDLAKAHVVALQFGAGWGEQTSTATDGGYLLKHAQDYYNKGGVRLK